MHIANDNSTNTTSTNCASVTTGRKYNCFVRYTHHQCLVPIKRKLESLRLSIVISFVPIFLVSDFQYPWHMIPERPCDFPSIIILMNLFQMTSKRPRHGNSSHARGVYLHLMSISISFIYLYKLYSLLLISFLP